MNKFNVGDKIQHKNMNQFSYTNIFSSPFIIMAVRNNEYTLKQANFYGERGIKETDNNCILSV